MKKNLASPGKKKVHINGQVWTYTIGKQYIKIVHPNRDKTTITNHSQVTGTPWDAIERMEWKSHWEVHPESVAAFIEIELLGKSKEVVFARLEKKHREQMLEHWEKEYPNILTPEARVKYMKSGEIDSAMLRAKVVRHIAERKGIPESEVGK